MDERQDRYRQSKETMDSREGAPSTNNATVDLGGTSPGRPPRTTAGGHCHGRGRAEDCRGRHLRGWGRATSPSRTAVRTAVWMGGRPLLWDAVAQALGGAQWGPQGMANRGGHGGEASAVVAGGDVAGRGGGRGRGGLRRGHD